MLTLAINTALSVSAIAIFDESSALLAEHSWPAQNNEAEKLLPQIQELLHEAGQEFGDITRVICLSGPGSFTGLRIGVTVANTIAHLTGAALYGINDFEYFWESLAQRVILHSRTNSASGGRSAPAFSKSADTSINIPADSATFARAQNILEKTALLIYAGRGGVYVSLDSTENFATDVPVIPLTELATYLRGFDRGKVFGDISPEQKAELKDFKFIEAKLTFGQIISGVLKKGLGQPVKLIQPLYIKEPAITQSKKSLA